MDLDFDSRSQEYEKKQKQKLLHQLSHKVFNLSEWNVHGMLLKLISIINHILIWSCPFSIQTRKPYLYDFAKKKNKKTKKNKTKKKTKTIRYEGWDLRPSGGQPLGSSLSRRLSSEGSCLGRGEGGGGGGGGGWRLEIAGGGATSQRCWYLGVGGGGWEKKIQPLTLAYIQTFTDRFLSNLVQW